VGTHAWGANGKGSIRSDMGRGGGRVEAGPQGVTGTAMPHYLPIHNNCKNSHPKTAAS
jgi:hypothetical protein